MILSASHAGWGIVGVIRGVKLDQSGKPLAHHQKVQIYVLQTGFKGGNLLPLFCVVSCKYLACYQSYQYIVTLASPHKLL